MKHKIANRRQQPRMVGVQTKFRKNPEIDPYIQNLYWSYGEVKSFNKSLGRKLQSQLSRETKGIVDDLPETRSIPPRWRREFPDTVQEIKALRDYWLLYSDLGSPSEAVAADAAQKRARLITDNPFLATFPPRPEIGQLDMLQAAFKGSISIKKTQEESLRNRKWSDFLRSADVWAKEKERALDFGRAFNRRPPPVPEKFAPEWVFDAPKHEFVDELLLDSEVSKDQISEPVKIIPEKAPVEKTVFVPPVFSDEAGKKPEISSRKKRYLPAPLKSIARKEAYKESLVRLKNVGRGGISMSPLVLYREFLRKDNLTSNGLLADFTTRPCTLSYQGKTVFRGRLEEVEKRAMYANNLGKTKVTFLYPHQEPTESHLAFCKAWSNSIKQRGYFIQYNTDDDTGSIYFCGKYLTTSDRIWDRIRQFKALYTIDGRSPPPIFTWTEATPGLPPEE